MPSSFKKFNLHDYVVYISFIAVVILFYFIIGGKFLAVNNIRNIAIQSTVTCISAAAMVMVISCGMIDLSIGAAAALSSIIAALVMQYTKNMALGILAGFLTGAFVGLINGVLISYGALPPFLVTLGVQGVVFGCAQWLSKMQAIPIYDKRFTTWFGSASVGGVPILFIWACLVFALSFYIMNQTKLGKKILATGANENAASNTGINTKKVKCQVMILSGLFSAAAGMMYAGRGQAARHSFGADMTFTVIASVILGGTLMRGGKARVIGAFVAALLLGMVDNGLIIIGFDVSRQTIVRGAVIVMATLLGTVTGGGIMRKKSAGKE
ncbi:MAG: ABC transporter permease [Clostridiales bacterium]|nr:ABC transporter permease [Clostridiales bacterium]